MVCGRQCNVVTLWLPIRHRQRTGGKSVPGFAANEGSQVRRDSRMGLTIDVNYDSSVSHAPSGFTSAVASVVSYFELLFSDPITITIDVGYGEVDGQSLSSGALGESYTNFIAPVSYSTFKNALTADAKTPIDASAIASLPTSDPTNGAGIDVSTAQAKALGLMPNNNQVDGYIGFSSSDPFTYNPNGRAVAGSYDFLGVVAHELSEVMGRISDLVSGASASSLTALDLFRYSAPGTRELVGGQAAYFSVDGGKTNLDNFNTDFQRRFRRLGRKRRQ